MGTTKLSSTDRGGNGMPQHLLGNPTAGVGTARSASDPAAPRAKDARIMALCPPGAPSAPHLANERVR